MQLHHFFEKSVDAYPNNIALICDNYFLSYKEVESRANQLAHHLLDNGIAKGSIVGILLERSAESYLSILAILKSGAAYVPIEVEYPDERINYILGDLPFDAVITSSTQVLRSGLELPKAIVLDEVQALIASESIKRPSKVKEDKQGENLCYVIYTSGSTGKPKGVEITHRSICHYVTVASELYAMTPVDRVYQGFSLAFDASLEETWMAFANGATLVACIDKDTRSGVGLIEFLETNKVSVFSTVPTLLASLEDTKNSLRLLILGGEACTATLVNRWMRKGLRIMNTYGPTEATVIATYAECIKDKEITIGKPLPGYEVLIVDEHLQPVIDGTVGELCIGGLGLARGYANRPDLTSEKFVPHPLNNTSILYRTGDLAVVCADGDIQYAGRVDDQIKLRGFRVELNEIEAVIMEHFAINQAVISLQELGQPTLVAYLVVDKHETFDVAHLRVFLQTKLPDYMMPSLFEVVKAFPLLASGKVNRKALPKPTSKVIAKEYHAPTTPLEKHLASIWETALHHELISIDADFFYDLGGHSLLAAKVISSLRKTPSFAGISILDLYQNPTIELLAKKIEHSNSQKTSHDPKDEIPRRPVNRLHYALCGAGQFLGCLIQYGISAWQFLAVILCYAWVTQYQRIFSFQGFVLYLGLLLLMPLVLLAITIGAKWLLLGRVKPGVYPLWGWFYLRWWFIQGLQNNKLQKKYLTGTPILNVYYRLLGAKIGKDCFISTTHIAIPDVVSIGSGTTLSNDSRVLGYIVEDGWLKIGTITIGDDCYVGSRSVININSTMENKAVLDDMSMLPSGMVIPKEQFFSGSPARQAVAPANHITVQPTKPVEITLTKSLSYGLMYYFILIFVVMLYYSSFIPGLIVLDYFYKYTNFLATICIATPIAAILFMVVHFANICISKRLILRKAKPGIYPVYSTYYLRQWTIIKILDIEEINVLADSLFFPQLLRALGAKIGKRVEMGEAPEIIPDLLTVEKGGFSASGVAIAWPAVYKGYVSYGRVKIGKNTFVGNVSLLPQGANLGDGGLLGCMTIPPSNNRASESNTFWLGSPPVYLPTREIMGGFPDEVTYNPSKRLYLTRIAIETFRVLLPSTCTLILAVSLFYILDYLLENTTMLTTALVLPVADLAINLLIVGGLVALKWLVVGKIKPCIKPLWDVFIWKNDIREFSFGYYINPHFTDLVMGTPFISMLYRSMGAKIGKRVYINTEGFAEFDLITIGDEVCINSDSLIQTHLYEDRIFKVDSLLIKEGCNVGVGSMVLYNTVMEPYSTLGSFSLLMKGETLPSHTYWEGSPAQCTSVSSSGLAEKPSGKSSKRIPARAVPVEGD